MSMRSLFLVCGLGVFGVGLFGEGVESAMELRQVKPLSLLEQKAEALDLDLTGLELDVNRSGLEEADWVRLLVQYEEDDLVKQWLVGIHGQMIKEEERPEAVPPMVVYSSVGPALEFSREPASVAIRIVGPYLQRKGKESGRKAKDFWTGAIVNEDFLTLGLDRACEVGIRLKSELSLREEGKLGIQFRGEPFEEDVVTAARAQWAECEVSETDLKSLVGAAPALSEFLGIALRTPELGKLALEMLDISKVGALLSGGLPSISLNFEGESHPLNPTDWGLPEGYGVYVMPVVVVVDGRQAMNCMLIVSKPVAPLTACSGIVALQAESLGKGHEKLFVRLLSGASAETVGVGSSE